MSPSLHTIVDLAIQGASSRQSVDLASGKEPESSPESSASQEEVQGPGDLERQLAAFVTKLRAYKQNWEESEGCQCPERQVIGDQELMSQRPAASRPASRSPERTAITLPPVQLGDGSRPQDGQLVGRLHLNIEDQRFQQAQYQQPSHPGENRRPVPSRDLGVHSILNPTEPDRSSFFGRQSPSVTASPPSALEPRTTPGVSPAFGSSPPFRGEPSVAPRHSFARQQIPGDGHTANLPRPRPILTPRSPSRVFSDGHAFGNATINAQQSPFLGDQRTYIAEPGQFASSNVPPLPTPPAGNAQMRYGFSPTSEAPSNEPRRYSTDDMRAPGRAASSESASPRNVMPPALFPHSHRSPPIQPSPGYYPGSSFPGASLAGSGGMGMQSMGQAGGVGIGGSEGGPYYYPNSHKRSSSSISSNADGSRNTSLQIQFL